jgi:peptidoglycan/LPS O-acetylase OafA/YrhL
MKPKYRADIDGLRSFAVIPVVLFHAKLNIFPGGFVGVDVFFVISGFLISNIIYSEVDSSSFSIIKFYERRVRRILPAYFALLAACFLLGAFTMMPSDYLEFARSCLSSLLFVSNIFFYYQSGDYFDAPEETKPLLHTWSLSVEEQFYIFFPPLIVALAYLSKRFGLPLRQSAILLMAFMSLALSIFAAYHSPKAAFYLMPSRAWELLVGSMLALPIASKINVRPLAEIATWVGMVLIIYATLFFDSEMIFPGAAALVPTIGAGLVIFGGLGGVKTKAASVLGCAPLRFIGLISYSLYLWHWPILVFSRTYFGEQQDNMVAVCAVGLSIVFATVSWRYIERPFRDSTVFGRGRLFRLAGAAGIVTACASGAIALAAGLPQRLPTRVTAIMVDQQYRDPLYTRCFDFKDTVRSSPFCVRGAPRVPPTFAVVGDSHGGAIAPAIFQAAERASVAGLQVTQGGWRPTHPYVRLESERDYIGKERQLENVLSNPSIRTVFIAVSWESAFSQRYHLVGHSKLVTGKEAVPESMRGLIQAHPGITFILLTDIPTSEKFGTRGAARAALFGRPFDVSLSRKEYLARRQANLAMLANLNAMKNVRWLDLGIAMCGAESCAGARNGKTLYIDTDHITVEYAYSLSHVFDEEMSHIKS